MRALYAAASGMIAQQLNVDTIAHNLANVNTVGFKRSRVDFQDLMYQTVRAPGAAAAEGVQVPSGLQLGLGTRAAATEKLFTEGVLIQTGAPLDLAIEGDGFFPITQPNGETAYTRSGAFKRDSEGNVVSSDGFPLDPPIAIPSDALDVFVGADGTVSVRLPGQTEAQEVGQIELARFANPAGLRAIGRGLFVETDASGPPTRSQPGADGLGTIAHGHLENSNVDVVEEMVNMIVAQRAYEANSRAIQIADEMLSIANNMRR